LLGIKLALLNTSWGSKARHLCASEFLSNITSLTTWPVSGAFSTTMPLRLVLPTVTPTYFFRSTIITADVSFLSHNYSLSNFARDISLSIPNARAAWTIEIDIVVLWQQEIVMIASLHSSSVPCACGYSSAACMMIFGARSNEGSGT